MDFCSKVKNLILGAERTEQKVREEKFIHAAREGDVQSIKKMVRFKILLAIFLLLEIKASEMGVIKSL